MDSQLSSLCATNKREWPPREVGGYSRALQRQRKPPRTEEPVSAIVDGSPGPGRFYSGSPAELQGAGARPHPLLPEWDPAETGDYHSVQERGPSTRRLIQQVWLLCVLTGPHTQGAPLPRQSAEPTEHCSTHVQGCSVQGQCGDSGVLLCAHVGLPLPERAGSWQNTAVACTQHCLVHTHQWGRPTGRKCGLRETLWYPHTRLLRVEWVGCCSVCTYAEAPAHAPERVQSNVCIRQEKGQS